MDLSTILSLGQTAAELGLTCSLTVLALFLSYSMLNVCDLSTDGCFTLGAAVGAVVALAGHPWLSLGAAMAAGICSGFVVAVLQTRMGVNSLLAGIIVNTALYSINIAVMGGSSLLNLNKAETVFTITKAALAGTAFSGLYKLVVSAAAVAAALVILTLFLRTRLGLAIRATGNNPIMVRSSSINPAFTTTVGLCVANAFTALSGCLMAQAQKAVDINLGTGMVTIALASLLIGGTVMGRGGVFRRLCRHGCHQIVYRFGAGQVHFAGEKRPSGKFAGFCLYGALCKQRRQRLRQHGRGAMALNFRHVLSRVGIRCMHHTAQTVVNDLAVSAVQGTVGKQAVWALRQRPAALRGKNCINNRKGLRSGDADDSNRSGSRPCRDCGNGLAHNIIDLISIRDAYSASFLRGRGVLERYPPLRCGLAPRSIATTTRRFGSVPVE